MKSENKNETGSFPSKWDGLFKKAGILAEAFEVGRSQRSRSTMLGNFLAKNVDRPVPIWFEGRAGTARLRVVDARSGQRRYHFEVTWDAEPPSLVGQDS